MTKASLGQAVAHWFNRASARKGDSMRRNHAVSHLIWAVLLMSLTAVPFVSASAQEIPPPPYLVTRSEGLVIGVAYDESRVKSVAPAGVPVAPGATGTIIMYTAREGYGLPPYSSSWMGLDLEGLDAPGGTKGRWMVSGLYGPRPVATALAEYFNYPTREGSTRVETGGWTGGRRGNTRRSRDDSCRAEPKARALPAGVGIRPRRDKERWNGLPTIDQGPVRRRAVHS